MQIKPCGCRLGQAKHFTDILHFPMNKNDSLWEGNCASSWLVRFQRPCASWRSSRWVEVGASWCHGVRRVEFTEALRLLEVNMGRSKQALLDALAREGSNLQRPCASWMDALACEGSNLQRPCASRRSKLADQVGTLWHLGVRKVEFSEAPCLVQVGTGEALCGGTGFC